MMVQIPILPGNPMVSSLQGNGEDQLASVRKQRLEKLERIEWRRYMLKDMVADHHRPIPLRCLFERIIDTQPCLPCCRPSVFADIVPGLLSPRKQEQVPSTADAILKHSIFWRGPLSYLCGKVATQDC